jgi:hypothetical protein
VRVRRLIACGALVVGLSIAAGAAAEPTARSAVAQGGTSFDAATGVITVNVGLKGALDADGNPVKWHSEASGSIGDAVQQWQQRVDNIWNGGFAAHAYVTSCGAPTPGSPDHFKLNFVITMQKADAANLPGHAEITLVDDVRDSVRPGPGGPSGIHDGDGPYLSDAGGTWGERTTTFDAQGQPDGSTPTTALIIAHEVGHLLGLSDDYTDTSLNHSVPLPGRAGTLMAGGDVIDQNLINRIGDQISKTAELANTCQYFYNAAYHAFTTTTGSSAIGTWNTTENWTAAWQGLAVTVTYGPGKQKKVTDIETSAMGTGTMTAAYTYTATGYLTNDDVNPSETCSGDLTQSYPSSIEVGSPFGSQIGGVSASTLLTGSDVPTLWAIALVGMFGSSCTTATAGVDVIPAVSSYPACGATADGTTFVGYDGEGLYWMAPFVQQTSFPWVKLAKGLPFIEYNAACNTTPPGGLEAVTSAITVTFTPVAAPSK